MYSCLNENLATSILRNFLRHSTQKPLGFDIKNLRAEISKYHCVTRLNDNGLEKWAASYLTILATCLYQQPCYRRFASFLINSSTVNSHWQVELLVNLAKDYESGQNPYHKYLSDLLPKKGGIRVKSLSGHKDLQIMIHDKHIAFWGTRNTTSLINVTMQKGAMKKASIIKRHRRRRLRL